MLYEDAAGGGGVLRDDKGVARAIFSCPSEVKDAETAEVGAIITALGLISEMGWEAYCPFFIKVGSTLVLQWLSEIESWQWMLQSLFKEIDKRRTKGCEISFCKSERRGTKWLLL